MATNRLSERGMIEATVRSTSKTVAFHLGRGKAGETAAAAAARLRDRSQAKLDAMDAEKRKEKIAA